MLLYAIHKGLLHNLGGAAQTVGAARWEILAVLNVQRFQIAVRLETGNQPMTNMPVIGNIFLQTDPHCQTSAPTAAALRIFTESHSLSKQPGR